MIYVALALDGAEMERRYPRRQEELRVHAALTEAGIDSIDHHILVPVSRRRSNGKRRFTTIYDPVPQLPGYAIACTDTPTEAWVRRVLAVTYRVGRRRCRAVVGIMGTIPDAEMRPLLERAGRITSDAQQFRLRPGDGARLASGPFAGEAVVTIESISRERAHVLRDGRRLNVPLASLEAA